MAKWSAAAALTERVVSGTWAPLGRVTSSPEEAWADRSPGRTAGMAAGCRPYPNHGWASGAAEAAATRAAAAKAFMVE